MKTPDKWIILKMQYPNKKVIYKLHATWVGSYIHGDAWSLNSGIMQVKDSDPYWDFTGYSGSIYRCHKEMQGCSAYTSGILDEILQAAAVGGIEASVLDISEFLIEFDSKGVNYEQ